MQVSEYMAYQWICEWLITSAIVRTVKCWGRQPLHTDTCPNGAANTWMQGPASPMHPLCGATHQWVEVGRTQLSLRLAPARAACMGDSGCLLQCRVVPVAAALPREFLTYQLWTVV